MSALSTPSSFAPEKLVIATRESRLAMWQALHVQSLLRSAYPGCDVQLLGMTTEGDRILDRALSEIGGKGQFIKELEVALHAGRADLAVHSLKDVPVEMPEGFALTVFMKREDPRDAFVSNRYGSFAELPQGAVVGTSSLRREAQIRAQRPDLVIRSVRGNLDTRLGKLDRGEYDAIILACAGLKRLGMADRIRAILSPDEMLPAVGQGILGLEIIEKRTELQQILNVLADPVTTQCALAERAVSIALGGSCHLPIAAYAEPEGANGGLRLRALVASRDGQRLLRAQASGEDPHDLGAEVGARLRAQGALDVLAAVE